MTTSPGIMVKVYYFDAQGMHSELIGDIVELVVIEDGVARTVWKK